VTRKKILVPFGPDGKDLKCVHHALALAERLDAGVVIVQWGRQPDPPASWAKWVQQSLDEVIADARLAGLSVTHMTVSGPTDDEIASLIENEGVDLLVLDADRWQLESTVLRHFPRLSGNIIRVREKEPMKQSVEEDGRRWLS
jgi:hypothetical protein